MMRIRYSGQLPGAIPGWRVFAFGDEDEAPDELAASLVAGGMFVAVDEAVAVPVGIPLVVTQATSNVGVSVEVTRAPEPAPEPSPPPAPPSEFVVEPVSPAPEPEQEHN